MKRARGTLEGIIAAWDQEVKSQHKGDFMLAFPDLYWELAWASAYAVVDRDDHR